MGGAIISVSGKTRKEVALKLKARIEEALTMGLVKEIESPIVYDQASNQFRAVLKVHS